MEKNNSEVNFHFIFLSFQKAVVNDPRIGPTHISLYVAILHYVNGNGFNSPFQVFSRKLMRMAKISSTATYAKCIQELKEFGYISYVPSNNPLTGSTFAILPLNI